MLIRYSKSAARALRQTHKAKLIRSKIEQLAADPDSLSANVTKLVGKPESRLRVQDMRILFRIENGVLEIDDIKPRGEAYRE